MEKAALKKSTTLVNSSNNQLTGKQIPHVEPVLPVAPVVPVESSVSMAPFKPVEERQESVAICQVKKLPVRQETVIEVEEVGQVFVKEFSSVLFA